MFFNILGLFTFKCYDCRISLLFSTSRRAFFHSYHLFVLNVFAFQRLSTIQFNDAQRNTWAIHYKQQPFTVAQDPIKSNVLNSPWMLSVPLQFCFIISSISFPFSIFFLFHGTFISFQWFQQEKKKESLCVTYCCHFSISPSKLHNRMNNGEYVQENHFILFHGISSPLTMISENLCPIFI